MAACARRANSLLHLQTRGRYEKRSAKRESSFGGGSSSFSSSCSLEHKRRVVSWMREMEAWVVKALMHA